MSCISLLQHPFNTFLLFLSLRDRESAENLRYDRTSRDYMYTKHFSVETRDKFPTEKIFKKRTWKVHHRWNKCRFSISRKKVRDGVYILCIHSCQLLTVRYKS